MASYNITPEFRSAKENFLLYYQKVMACKFFYRAPLTSTLKTAFQALSNRNISLVPAALLSKIFTLNHLVNGFLILRRHNNV